MSAVSRLPGNEKTESKSSQAGPSSRDKHRAHHKEDDFTLFAGALLNATAVPAHPPAESKSSELGLSASKRIFPGSKLGQPDIPVRSEVATAVSKAAHRAVEKNSETQVTSLRATPATVDSSRSSAKAGVQPTLLRATPAMSVPVPQGRASSGVTAEESGKTSQGRQTMKRTGPLNRVGDLAGLRISRPSTTITTSARPVSAPTASESNASPTHKHSGLTAGTLPTSSLLTQAPTAQTVGHTVGAPTKSLDIGSPTAYQQFVQLVSHQVAESNQSALVVQVHPVGMGQITVSVNEQAGHLHVHVAVAETQTLQWFHAQHQGLMESLAQSGHDVSQMTFSMSPNFADSGQRDQTPRNQPVTATGKSAGGREARALQGVASVQQTEGRWYV